MSNEHPEWTAKEEQRKAVERARQARQEEERQLNARCMVAKQITRLSRTIADLNDFIPLGEESNDGLLLARHHCERALEELIFAEARYGKLLR